MLFPAILLAVSAFTMTSAANILLVRQGYCVHEDKTYLAGQKLVLDDCQYTCECKVDEDQSYFMCEPLCSRYFDFVCTGGEEPEWIIEDTVFPQCKCRRYFCPKKLSVENLIDFGVEGAMGAIDEYDGYDGYDGYGGYDGYEDYFEPEVETTSRFVD